jgi:N-acetylmuramoyl-L-alanine amidase
MIISVKVMSTHLCLLTSTKFLKLAIMQAMRLARVILILSVLLGISSLFVASSGSPSLRIAFHPEGNFTRIVLDAPGAPRFTSSINGKSLSVRLEPFNATAQSGTGNTAHLTSWKLEMQGKAGVLTMQTNLTLRGGAGYKVFALPAENGAPNRVVIDLGAGLKTSATSTTSSVTPKPVTKPRATPISAQVPKRPKLTVVLDPGHGGIDPGNVGYVVEKKITLDIAAKVRALLQARGVTVIMTRTTDTSWQDSCGKRCDLDKRADMGSTDRNAFVSIHVNGATSAAARGIETWLFGQAPDSETLAQAERENGGGSIGKAITAEARNIARDLLNDQLAQLNASFSSRLAYALQRNMIAQTGARDRGVKRGPFWVIRKPRIPAVLVEVGFAGNPTEGSNLNTQSYRQRLALAIANGTASFLGL